MRVISLDSLDAREVFSFGSSGFGVVPIATEAHVVVARLAPGGVIARHPAVVHQALVVLTGEAEVSGEDGVTQVLRPGSAAVWSAGESHETSSQTGLVALVVEGDGITAAFA